MVEEVWAGRCTIDISGQFEYTSSTNLNPSPKTVGARNSLKTHPTEVKQDANCVVDICFDVCGVGRGFLLSFIPQTSFEGSMKGRNIFI